MAEIVRETVEAAKQLQGTESKKIKVEQITILSHTSLMFCVSLELFI